MSQKKVSLNHIEFKSIALLIDKKDRIWLHDAITRALIIFDSAKMAEIRRFEGKIINLCILILMPRLPGRPNILSGQVNSGLVPRRGQPCGLGCGLDQCDQEDKLLHEYDAVTQTTLS